MSCKRFVSLLVLFCLVFTLFVPAGAEINDYVRTSLEAVGLMQGYEDGSFGENDELTRAQMTMIAAKIMRVDNTVNSTNIYTDVPDDHWAKDVINTLSQLKIVNGMSDGIYMPEKSVTFFEACKMIVSVLGYGDQAEIKGGYPLGYVAMARSLGLLKNVSSQEGIILRGEVAKILYAALDVKPMMKISDSNYLQNEETLYSILTDNDNLTPVTGILTETARTSIQATVPTVEEGYIRIGTDRFLCDKDMDAYIGQEITAYVYQDKGTDLYKLKNFFVSRNTKVTEASAEDVYWQSNTATVSNVDARDKKYTLSDSVKTIYNGRLADVPAEERTIYYGGYRFVDANDDGAVDVLFIDEAQSFIVDKVNTKTATVYFQDRATLNGRNAVVLDIEKDEQTVILTNTDGEALTIEDIEAGNGITIFASEDERYIKAIISGERIEGVITEYSDEGIRIDGQVYKLAIKPDGDSYFTPDVGERATYVLDAYGNIINAGSTVESTYLYAYVIDAKRASGISGTLSLQTVSGTQPKKEVVKSGDDETISYYFQNDAVRIYNCADSFLLNNSRESANKVDPAALKGKLVAFHLNSNGEIREIYTASVSNAAAAYVFNANILSFGGESVLRGYATDNNTMFICLPTGSGSASTDDYYVQVKITDESATNKVQGAVFFPDSKYEDPDTEPVDILLIEAAMDASATPPVQMSSDVYIVGKVTQVLGTVFDDQDSLVYKLELLNGTEKITEVTHASGAAANVAKNLRKGDLIRYVKDGFGRIVNISKLVSVQGLGDSYSPDVYIGSGVESGIYGMAYHSVPSVYDYFSNQMVDRLQLAYDQDGTILSDVYRLFHEDMPMVYKYDKQGGWVSPGSIEDIRTYNQVGDGADSILAIIENNDIKALVIITDN